MSFAASATADANLYGLIVQKNSFRLLPLVQLPIEAPRPSAKIVLQGMTTVLGRRQVLLQLTLPGSVSEVSVILGEGERTGCVEVIQVDQSARTVRVLNYGQTQELSLKADSRVPLASRQKIQLGGANIISIQRPAIFTFQNPEP